MVKPPTDSYPLAISVVPSSSRRSGSNMASYSRGTCGSSDPVLTTQHMSSYRPPKILRDRIGGGGGDGKGAGVDVVKVNKYGKKNSRRLSLSGDNRTILITTNRVRSVKNFLKNSLANKKDTNIRCVDISLIDRVQRGQVTEKFGMARGRSRSAAGTNRVGERHSLNDHVDRANSFSIIFYGNRKTIDLMVADDGEYDALLKMFDDLMTLYKRSQRKVHRDILILEHAWIELGKELNDPASLAELHCMLDILNAGIKRNVFNSAFKRYCTSAEVHMEHGINVVQAFHLLQEIRPFMFRDAGAADPCSTIWNEVMNNEKQDASVVSELTTLQPELSPTIGRRKEAEDTMSDKTFLKFLQTKQKEPKADLNQVWMLFRHLNEQAGADFPGEERKTRINRSTFEAYIASDLNDIFDPLKGREGRSDMTQPLSNYWINTSHKTYRLADDGTSETAAGGCRVQSYTNALYRGCRCVEADVWDGGVKYGNEPVVCATDPQTGPFRSKDGAVPFADVVASVKAFLKSHPKSFPIILSLENHCSLTYQKIMVSHLHEILGDSLYRPKVYVGHLPSPEALKGKVVLRGKRPDVLKEGSTVINDDFDTENDFTQEELKDLTKADSVTIDEDYLDEVGGTVIGFEAMGSVISDSPHAEEKTPDELLQIAEQEAEASKTTAKEAEGRAFDLQVLANRAEEQAKKLLSRIGLELNEDGDELDAFTEEIEKERTALEPAIEMQLSQDQGVEVEDYFADALEGARSKFVRASTESVSANEASAIALSELLEATTALSVAADVLQRAEVTAGESAETATRAASEARNNRSHAETASNRVVAVRDLLQRCRDQASVAETVSSTAKAEAKISEQRAREAEARSAKAQATAEAERNRADSETKNEELLEMESSRLEQKLSEAAEASRAAKHTLEKTEDILDDVNDEIEGIEQSVAFRKEKREQKRRAQSLDDDVVSVSTRASSASLRMLTTHQSKLEEHKILSEKLKNDSVAFASAEVALRHAQLSFEEVAQKAQMQSDVAGSAQRQADQSTHMADQLAEHAEEEREAANLRHVAHDKAEINVKRCDADLASMKAQLSEAERAAEESERLAVMTRMTSETLAVESQRAQDTSKYEKIVSNRETLKNQVRTVSESARVIKGKADQNLATAKTTLAMSTEVYHKAQHEAEAEIHRSNAEKQAKRNAVAARTNWTILRKKAENAMERSQRCVSHAAEKVAAVRHAAEYKKKKSMIAPMDEKLARLVVISSTKFKYWAHSLNLPSLQMHNICEGMMVTTAEDGPTEWKKWMHFNKNHLTRTFPSDKLRQNLSNYNPMIPWSFGCQMVSMNIQSSSGMLLLVDGRFRENGSCGYVLKPSRLNDATRIEATEKEQSKSLWLRILSGNGLPKAEGATGSDAAVSPRVKVVLYDGVPGQGSVQHTTDTVQRNGLCPVWKETEGAVFTIASPSVAVLLFTVWDRDEVANKDYFIAAAAVPFSCLREGYRSVALFDSSHTRSGAYAHASLMVEVFVE